MASLRDRRHELTNVLQDFYANPVAQVSTELFLTVGAVIFFALFAIRPTLLTMSDLTDELEEKRELNTELSQKIAALNTVQAQYLSLQDQLGVLDEALPNHPELDLTLSIIEKIASDNQLVIEQLTLKDVPDETSIKDILVAERGSYTLSISLTGEYEQLRSFLANLQESRRALTVASIVFNTREEFDQRQLEAIVTIDAHYFREAVRRGRE